MKISIFIQFLLILFIPLYTLSQSITDVARSRNLSWCGIDYTHSRFLGFDQNELDSIKFVNIDFTNLSEDDKSYIKKSFGKKSMNFATFPVREQNGKLNVYNLSSEKEYYIKIDTIKNIIRQYKFNGTGYSILGIVETIEKVSNAIYIWIVYIDNVTSNMVSAKRYTGTSFARDLRNGDYYSTKGVKLIIKMSGYDLIKYGK